MSNHRDSSCWEWVQSSSELVELDPGPSASGYLQRRMAHSEFLHGLRTRVGTEGRTTVVAPIGVGSVPLAELDWGHNLSADLAQLWLLDHWKGLPAVHRSGILLSVDRTFGRPPAGTIPPPFAWENLPPSMDPRVGLGGSLTPSSPHPDALFPTLFYVLPVPYDGAPTPEQDYAHEAFEWIDTRGPTCLTLHRPSNHVLASHRMGAEDLQAVAEGLIELYLPVYDGESYLIWRPDRPPSATIHQLSFPEPPS